MVHFAPLEEQTVYSIAEKYLHQLQSRAAVSGLQLSYDPGLAAHLGKQGIGKGGARQLRRLVQEQLEGPIASLLLRSAKKPTAIEVTLGREGPEFSCILQ